MKNAHSWHLIAGFNSQDGASMDTIDMCSVCGVVRHSYRPDSPHYPRFFHVCHGVFASIGGTLGESSEEPSCVPYPYEAAAKAVS